MELLGSSLITDTYSVLWKMIIRPPRSEYSMAELGPARFRLQERVYVRHDLELVNDRGHKLQCSHFRPVEQRGSPPPCVVYLHGNCSSRLEACEAMQVLLPRGVTLFTLDLSGSGKSDGEYISLGHYEQHDLRAVVDHLRDTKAASAVGIWGRSMGAATGILRAAEDWCLGALVLDSPFSSLPMVARELVNSQVARVPEFLVNMALQSVRKEIQSRANFDIEELRPIKVAPRARSPALFAVAKDDDFVLPHHTLDLHAAWGGNDRKLITFEGGHNGARPRWFLEEAAEFLRLRLSSEFAADGSRGRGGGSQARERADSWEDEAPLLVVPPPPEEPPAAVKVPGGSSSSSRGARQEPPSDAAQRATAQQLLAMGFSEDIASEAARRNSTVEAAVEWILQHSTLAMQESAQALGKFELRAPSTLRGRELNAPVGEQSAGGSRAAVSSLWGSRKEVSDPPAPAGASGPGRPATVASGADVGSLVTQLLELGFPAERAERAARRSSSVEGAIEWLASQGEL